MTENIRRGGTRMPPSQEAVARAKCHRCPAELSVTAWDASLALEALHELLQMHRWSLDASGLRVCPNHLPPVEEAA